MKVFHYHWLAHTACEQAFDRNECDDTAQKEKRKTLTNIASVRSVVS